ncbi:methyltransferase [Nocardioides sp. TF02-7]|uniref:methyltransferase n=1 Tax=Nocardioides sp. TF02-7 TaxID=2917724 RepID=UPI001F06C5B8|nr:methyltransferase [Nocardioides sp. TF02-7]UMG93662.1 methyltransferase [Nocardioides sp. TF02-7]
MTAVDTTTETIEFSGLPIDWDRRVLRPRGWTAAQSRWVAELAEDTPPGPILELCCGAGHIGLLAASLTGRELVQVDRDPVATDYARRNAATAGVATDVRTASVVGALRPDEVFPLVVVDPPWVPSTEVGDFPEDPVGAIDGGADGTDQIALNLGVALRHLHPAGHVVLQVGTDEQVAVVRSVVEGLGSTQEARHEVLDVRDCRPGGLLVHIGRVRDTREGGQRAPR